MPSLYQFVTAGCATDKERRKKANALADKAGIHRGLMYRYLRGEVRIGAKNAYKLERATDGAVRALDLLYGDDVAKQAG